LHTAKIIILIFYLFIEISHFEFDNNYSVGLLKEINAKAL